MQYLQISNNEFLVAFGKEWDNMFSVISIQALSTGESNNALHNLSKSSK